MYFQNVFFKPGGLGGGTGGVGLIRVRFWRKAVTPVGRVVHIRSPASGRRPAIVLPFSGRNRASRTVGSSLLRTPRLGSLPFCHHGRRVNPDTRVHARRCTVQNPNNIDGVCRVATATFRSTYGAISVWRYYYDFPSGDDKKRARRTRRAPYETSAVLIRRRVRSARTRTHDITGRTDGAQGVHVRRPWGNGRRRPRPRATFNGRAIRCRKKSSWPDHNSSVCRARLDGGWSTRTPSDSKPTLPKIRTLIGSTVVSRSPCVPFSGA